MKDTNSESGFIILHYGPMGIERLRIVSKIAEIMGEINLKIDVTTANMADAGFAFSENKNVSQKLQDRLLQGSINDMEEKYPDLPADAIRWLASGQYGQSSEAMLYAVFGSESGLEKVTSHPLDISDLRRCFILYESVEEVRDNLHLVAKISDCWADIIEDWHDIMSALEKDYPQWRNGFDSDFDNSKSIACRKLKAIVG